ncbi:MAG: right-handed parallel beta-helix repeat-containing protein, partial [Planctomycetota bacterium]
MARPAIVLVTVLSVMVPASAEIIVRDWQFNTPGDTEGWTAQSWTVNALHVAAAVQGSETVLTCDRLQNQADPKLYWPNEAIALPPDAASWQDLIIRIRQIGPDGATPVPFDNSGTGVINAGAFPTLWPIPTASDPEGAPPVVVVPQADEWLLIMWDLTGYSGTINPQVRMDPIQGTYGDGPGDVLGNFEIDYVTLTAGTPTTVTAAAGADQVVEDEDDDGIETVTLDGSGSFDSDGTIVSYEWTEDLVPLATGVTPTVTLPVGSHLIELTVTDDSGDSDTDTVAVTIKPYVPPMTYYLDAVNDDDATGDGSAAAPWRTLAKAQSVVIGGDTVVLASGHYGGFQAIAYESGGWDLYDDWVVYKAADGADVRFDRIQIACHGITPDNNDHRGFYDAYLRFEGIHVLDGVTTNRARRWALVDCRIERIGPWTGTSENIEKTAVFFRDASDIRIDGCEITNTGTGVAGDGHNIHLLNCHIHDGKHDGVRVAGWWDSLVESGSLGRLPAQGPHRSGRA